MKATRKDRLVRAPRRHLRRLTHLVSQTRTELRLVAAALSGDCDEGEAFQHAVTFLGIGESSRESQALRLAVAYLAFVEVHLETARNERRGRRVPSAVTVSR